MLSKFKYLRTTSTIKYYIHEQFKSGIDLGDAC
jgi:hypothetical protein